MERVLQHACDAQVLLFCSSPDQETQARSDAEFYPFDACRPRNFFRIGAAANDGRPFEWIASPEDVDFFFPGAEVVEHHDNNSNPQYGIEETKLQSVTGSSVPTALGAGLAATILYSLKTAALAGTTSAGMADEPVSSHDTRKIMGPESMRNAFENLGSATDGRFIKICKKFEPAIKVLQNPSKSTQDKFEIISLLCRIMLKEN